MSTNLTIEIDLELHKMIETERNSFEESHMQILKRLLGMPSAASRKSKSWMAKGAELPHGTQLRMTYNGQRHTALIEDGIWRLDNGEISTSPSAAAWQLARTKAGNNANIDGWHYWEALKPGEQKWRVIHELRSE